MARHQLILVLSVLRWCMAAVLANHSRPISRPTLYGHYQDKYSSSVFLIENHLGCLSCFGRCGELTEMKFGRLCACDSLCEKFRDCCPDYWSICSPKGEFQHENNQLLPSLNFSCIHGVLVASSCPYSAIACRRFRTDINTFLPVTDSETGIHYSNLLCAQCNGVTHIIPWNLNVSDKHSGENLQSLLRPLDSFQISKPGANNGLFDTSNRMCLTNHVSHCLPGWKDKAIQAACEEGYRSYVTYNNTVYLNVFCAMCNNAISSHFVCDAYQLWLLANTKFFKPHLYSLRLYFHLGFGDGIITSKTCPSNYAYYYFDESCRPLGNEVKESANYLMLNISVSFKNQVKLVSSPHKTTLSLLGDLDVSFGTVFNFTVEKSKRFWKTGKDKLQIRASSEQFSGSIFVERGQNIGRFLMEKMKRDYSYITFLSVIISTANAQQNCSVMVFSIQEVIFSSLGVATVRNTFTIQPGEYYVINDTVVTCRSDEVSPPVVWDQALGWTTVIAMLASVMCLLIHLILNCFLRPQQHWRTSGLACCFLVTNVTYLTGPLFSSNPGLCYCAGVLLHWGFLASLAWMSMIAIDIWIALSSSTTRRQSPVVGKNPHLAKIILPLLAPTVVVGISVIMDKYSKSTRWHIIYGAGKLCWIRGLGMLRYLFILPGGILILITSVFTILSAWCLYTLSRINRRTTVAKERNYFLMFVKLAAMTGLGWCVGFVAVPTNDIVLFFIFVLLTATQGVWLLLVTWCGKCVSVLGSRQGNVESNPQEFATPVS